MTNQNPNTNKSSTNNDFNAIIFHNQAGNQQNKATAPPAPVAPQTIDLATQLMNACSDDNQLRAISNLIGGQVVKWSPWRSRREGSEGDQMVTFHFANGGINTLHSDPSGSLSTMEVLELIQSTLKEMRMNKYLSIEAPLDGRKLNCRIISIDANAGTCVGKAEVEYTAKVVGNIFQLGAKNQPTTPAPAPQPAMAVAGVGSLTDILNPKK